MTLGDILEEIAEKAKHHLSDESIVRKINNLQAEIFREYKRIPTVSRADLVKGLVTYPLPCPLNNIDQLLVDGVEYELRDFNENKTCNFYYYLNGTIGIYPPPEKDVSDGLLVFHYLFPTRLSIDAMDAQPDLDADFRMLLVWGVAKDVAENDKDQTLFGKKYESLLANYIVASATPLPDMRVE